MQEIFESEVIPGRQKRNVVVAVGRFSPPTRGHYKLINAMKAFIRDNPDLKLDAQPVVVIISGSKTDGDKERNPLSGEERKLFMENSGRANGVKFLTAPSAFDAFAAVRKASMEPLAIAAGADRKKVYEKLLHQYFTQDGTPVKHGGIAINRHFVPGLDRDTDTEHDDGEDYYQKVIDMINDGEAVSDEMISGSLARFAARKGEDKAFAYIVGMENKPILAKKMQQKIVGSSK
jgi:hypothetical protein